ncbi:tetratricopeptide repeat protein [Ligilactobacillus salitolerans]|uniref:Tetratricopeptide repeat protein n=1 Tax=Ligilactobacillus salitolerans TaxID=1808352 RepID=A0A401IQX6_9LACO|nr:tetratricopeptide repeat protein [Ligilactobacillus salitolerans]GBG93930.1 tetratricopeptide repeat protein [Ligilactobacillus salitolerans]
MGLRNAQQKKNQQIVQKMIKALDDDPYEPRRYYDLGSMLTEMQSFQQAEELFLKGLNVFEKEPAKQNILHYGLGNVYYSAGMYTQAVQQFDLVTDQKLRLDSLMMLAQSYYAQQQYQQALAYALTVSEKRPADPSPSALLGDCFLALGDFKNAQNYYDKSLAKDPANVRVNFQRGIVALALGEDGSRFFQQVKQTDPKFYRQNKERLDDIATLIKDRQDPRE